MSNGEGNAGRNLVELARRTIKTFILEKRKIDPPDDVGVPGKAGVFVSIKKHKQLRGCIGTLLPVTDSVSSEVVENAISAATRDPRFPPVAAEELDELEISVDVLSSPEPVEDITSLDPSRFGVIVRSRGKAGVLLPDLEGIEKAEDQVAIARRKAGIGEDDPVELFRFEVKRYT
jgi:AmmeMemoRadiSam system protein A